MIDVHDSGSIVIQEGWTYLYKRNIFAGTYNLVQASADDRLRLALYKPSAVIRLDVESYNDTTDDELPPTTDGYTTGGNPVAISGIRDGLVLSSVYSVQLLVEPVRWPDMDKSVDIGGGMLYVQSDTGADAIALLNFGSPQRARGNDGFVVSFPQDTELGIFGLS